MATLDMLISMGFPEKSAARAIEVTGNKGVEEAMEWLLAHADDPAVQSGDVAGATAAGAADATATAADASAADASAADASAADAGAADASAADASATGADVTPAEARAAGDGESAADESADSAMDTTESEEKPGTSADKEAKSIKCDECNKLFKNSEEVEFHAAKSGHSSFSESTEEKVPLTEEQKKQKLLELEEKLKSRRKAKQEEEERENREKEKRRIEMGKNVAEIKRKHQEDENRKLAEEKRREKLEDKMARQRVKAMIESDKEARRLKMAAVKGEVLPPAPAPTPAPPAAAAPGVKKTYDESRIQFRLPSGPPIIQAFKAKEPLSAVLLWLTINHPPSDSTVTTNLSTTFPRKLFTEEDMEAPLDSLGLVPSSVLMVQYK